jgi:hypothetical protein
MTTRDEKQARAERIADRTAVTFAIGQLVGLAMKYSGQETLAWELKEVVADLGSHFGVRHPFMDKILAEVQAHRGAKQAPDGGLFTDEQDRCEHCGYSEVDKRLHGDHHLCPGDPEYKAEKPTVERGVIGETREDGLVEVVFDRPAGETPDDG